MTAVPLTAELAPAAAEPAPAQPAEVEAAGDAPAKVDAAVDDEEIDPDADIQVSVPGEQLAD